MVGMRQTSKQLEERLAQVEKELAVTEIPVRNRTMSSAPSTSYDTVPYHSHPFAQTHPDRLATVATLLGLKPPPVERCRVLELGCAGGGNLIPMALGPPESTFTGIDLSIRQVADG